MKRVIKVVNKNSGCSVEREFNVRNISHLDSQLKFPHKVEKPKKGKGSYVRSIKHKESIYSF